MDTVTILQSFDRYLAARGLRFEAVIIGGAALNLLGIVSRATKDCDVLHPALPREIELAAAAFAKETTDSGSALDSLWLNNGPMSLTGQLPEGWQDRLQPAFNGVAIELRTLGRIDLLRSKLFALCDRAIDLGDCIALMPTAIELKLVLPWLEYQDANPDWPAHVRATLTHLARKLGYGL
jgi:Nucleotidyltransferase of unknown function (DUF6036)